MSYISFASRNNEVKIRGSERAYADITLKNIAKSFFTTENNTECLDITDMVDIRLTNGKIIDVMEINLNTAWILGSDIIKLLARIHGQCEIHCYIKIENHTWFKNIINAGLKQNILRHQMGWEELLSCDFEDTIICSYSVCNNFPSFDCLPEDHPLKLRTDEERFEEFYNLPDVYEICLQNLYKDDTLEISPITWEDYRFGDKLSWFDIYELENTKGVY